MLHALSYLFYILIAKYKKKEENTKENIQQEIIQEAKTGSRHEEKCAQL